MTTSTEHAAASVQVINATTLKIELGVLAAPLGAVRGYLRGPYTSTSPLAPK
jgi:hypothetical protein